MTQRTILVVLVGGEGEGVTDHYQLLQEQAARAEAAAAGVGLEVVYAPAFDHLRVIRKQLSTTPTLDAVVAEPGSLTTTTLLLNGLEGRTGLVLLNAWAPEVASSAADWGPGLPFGTVSTDHGAIGEILGRQAAARLHGGTVLCVTGPAGSSAATERLAGMRRALPSSATVHEAPAGGWTVEEGRVAFGSWYGLFRSRKLTVDVLTAQSDELAMGVRQACLALPPGEHRDQLLGAPLLGVDACPDYGRRLVDDGTLATSVVTPPNTAEAIRSLVAFWTKGVPVPLRATTAPSPHPPRSA